MPSAGIPTAIFVHGAGAGGWEWTVWQRVFAASGCSALAPDLRAGATGLAATRLDDYIRQVRAWCGGCGRPFALIGASLGGLLALKVAPDSACAALVLINPLLPGGSEPGPARVERADVVAWGSERSLSGTHRAMPDGDDAARLFAFRRWRDESGAVLREAAAATIEMPGCPVLIVAGERDADCPPAASRLLATRLRADFVLLPGASHVGPLLGRDAARIAESTRQWLASRA